MEQFSLEKYLANPSRKVVTRAGNSVRIICTDRKANKEDPSRKVVGLVDIGYGEEEVETWDEKGNHFHENTYTKSSIDLFFAPETHEGWINVYRYSDGGHAYAGAVYDSKEDAEKRKTIDENYVTTIKIEWEE